MNLVTRNARIKDTFLGIEDHGIFTAVVYLEGDGWGQGFGTYCFGSKETSTPEQNHNLSLFITEVLRIAGVESWEELPGKMVRMEGTNSQIHRIGHIFREDWFCPKEEFNK